MENTTLIPNTGNSEIVIYQPDDIIRLEVRMHEETLWLTQQQMAVINHISTTQCDSFCDIGYSVCFNLRQIFISIATSQFGFFSSLYMLLLSQGSWWASHSTLRPCRSSSAATIFPMSNPCICSFSDIKKSVNFCLNGGSGLPVLQTRKPTDNAVSVLLSRVIQWKLSRFPFT